MMVSKNKIIRGDKMKYIINDKEEIFSSLTHYAGIPLGIIGGILLIIHAKKSENIGYLIGCSIYIFGVILLYSMSGTYHILNHGKLKKIFKIFDHSAIYVLISSSYMPYLLGYFDGTTKWVIFFAQWGITLVGIILKIFFAGKWSFLSTLIYLAMGWMVLFVIKDLKALISPFSFWCLVASGITYSLGTIFYSLDKFKYMHGIWHIFVLGGSFLNYLSIYFIK